MTSQEIHQPQTSAKQSRSTYVSSTPADQSWIQLPITHFQLLEAITDEKRGSTYVSMKARVGIVSEETSMEALLQELSAWQAVSRSALDDFQNSL